MWHWATSFRRALALATAVLSSAAALPVSSAVLITVDEAMALAYPGAELERQTLFLTEEQLATAAQASGVDGQAAVVTRYVARRDGELVGVAYLDTHKVRTLPETVLIALDPQGRILTVEVVSFREPPEYLPPDPWYAQFENSELGPELGLKRSIRPVTGATLTAVATTQAVRRMLAVHSVAPLEKFP